MKKLLKILLFIIIIFAVAISITQFVGNQEIKTLIDEGVLSSDYSQYDLAMLCEKLDDTIFWGCLSGGVW
jgi:hypothetical protein